MNSDHRRRLLHHAATIFLNLESQTSAALRAFPLPLYAARSHTEAGDFHDGARPFEHCGRLVEVSDWSGERPVAAVDGSTFGEPRRMTPGAGAWNLFSDCGGDALPLSTSSSTGPTDFIRWLCTARCGAHGLLTRDVTLHMRESLNNVLGHLRIHVDEGTRQDAAVPCLQDMVSSSEWRGQAKCRRCPGRARKAKAPKARSGRFQEKAVGHKRSCERSRPTAAVREGLLLRTKAEACTRFVQCCSGMEVQEALRGAVERFKNIAMWFSRRTPLESLVTSTRVEDAAALCRWGRLGAGEQGPHDTPRKTFETSRLLSVARG